MSDISNIRITAKAESFLRRLNDFEKVFSDDKMAAKFAVSYAIKNNLDMDLGEDLSLEGTTYNKWDSASLDSDGSLRLILSVRHPQVEEPFRMIQVLVSKGLEDLSDKCKIGNPIEISKFL